MLLDYSLVGSNMVFASSHTFWATLEACISLQPTPQLPLLRTPQLAV